MHSNKKYEYVTTLITLIIANVHMYCNWKLIKHYHDIKYTYKIHWKLTDRTYRAHNNEDSKK